MNYKIVYNNYIENKLRGEKMKIIKEIDVKFPTYAISYLEYGEPGDLSEQDIKNVDEWYNTLKCDESPYGPNFDFGTCSYFEPYPVFGLPCDCVDLKIFWFGDD